MELLFVYTYNLLIIINNVWHNISYKKKKNYNKWKKAILLNNKIHKRNIKYTLCIIDTKWSIKLITNKNKWISTTTFLRHNFYATLCTHVCTSGISIQTFTQHENVRSCHVTKQVFNQPRFTYCKKTYNTVRLF